MEGNTKADIIIVGAGIVGLALCARLVQSGLRVILVDRCLPKGSAVEPAVLIGQSPAWVSALGLPAQRLLQKLALWEQLVPYAVAYPEMRVFMEKQTVLHFYNTDIGCESLGHIVNNQHLKQVLWMFIKQSAHKNLSIIEGDPQAWDDRAGELSIKGGQRLQAKLCIGADGANSWVRRKALIPLQVDQTLQESAWVGVIHHTKGHGQMARQVFFRDGVIGLLPNAQWTKSVVIWSSRHDKSQYFAKSKQVQLCARLAGIFEGEEFEVQGQWRQHQIYSQQSGYYSGRCALVGDAAVCIHPLAGQGLNLGMRQVWILSHLLHQAYKSDGLMYPSRVLQQYKRDCIGFDTLTRKVVKNCRLWSGQSALIQTVLPFGVGILNRFPLLRRQIIRHALYGDMPEGIV